MNEVNNGKDLLVEVGNNDSGGANKEQNVEDGPSIDMDEVIVGKK